MLGTFFLKIFERFWMVNVEAKTPQNLNFTPPSLPLYLFPSVFHFPLFLKSCYKITLGAGVGILKVYFHFVLPSLWLKS